MKKYYVLFGIVFIALLLAPGVLTFVNDIPFSENENRTLTVKEDISYSFSDGEMQSTVESYMSDQFPLRSVCTEIQAFAKTAMGKRDINGAYIGKNGRLFQKITDTDIDISKTKSYVKKLQSACKKSGNTPVTVMPVPSAGISLKNFLPQNACMYNENSVLSCIEECGELTLVNLSGRLAESGDYYKTDHHWTTYGAYKAYRQWNIAHRRTTKSYEAFNPQTVTSEFYGSLYSKVLLKTTTPDSIELIEVPQTLTVIADGKQIDFYDYSALEKKDKYCVFMGGNHGVTVVENSALPDGKTLLLLKDSFANSFVPYLTWDYKTIVIIDERYAAVSIYDLAKTYNADEIAVVKEFSSFC